MHLHHTYLWHTSMYILSHSDPLSDSLELLHLELRSDSYLHQYSFFRYIIVDSEKVDAYTRFSKG